MPILAPAAETMAGVEPEGPSSSLVDASRPVVLAKRHMISTAHPLASAAGLEMLRAGGSAVDAAIAAALVLNLVEPESSGVGGGGYLLHYEAASGRLEALDGRETAPASAKPDMFLDERGNPLTFTDAVESGLSVGVPGLLRLLEEAHRRHGRLPWARLFQPAIRLAEHGFLVSPRLYELLTQQRYFDERFPVAADYFLRPDGSPKPVGTRITNPDYAATLRRIAAEGAKAFYEGEIARAIVATVAAAPRPGHMSLADLSGYRVKERSPVCGPFRQWTVCGMPPSSSGGIAVLQILGTLEHFSPQPGQTLDWIHWFAEANRRVFAERNRTIGDPDFVAVPVARLTDPARLAEWARAIAAKRPAPASGPHQTEPPSTSHLSVVDDDGNAVSLTASIENAFGSRRMVAGFLLNNELTDFSFRPGGANQVEPGKRPRSSMAPTIAFTPDGRLGLVIGSPGGPFIIAYVAKALIGVIDWGLDIQQAISLPNVANRDGDTEIERHTPITRDAPELEKRGHKVTFLPLTSGLQGIAVRRGHLEGGADTRREGEAMGD